MKKKILAIVAMLCMVLSMVGCSKEATNYVNKLAEVAKWEAAEEKGDFSFSMKVGDEAIGVKADYTAYQNTVDTTLEATFTIKEVQAGGQTIDTTKGAFKLSPIKVYVTANKMYMNTAIVKDICKLSGVEVPADLAKEYVALDITSYMEVLNLTEEQVKANHSFEKSIEQLKVYGIELPVKQNQDTYSIELNAEQIVSMMFKVMNVSLEQQTEMLTAQYKAMGLTDDEIKEVLNVAKTVYSDETKAEVIKAMAGSKATFSTTFGKDEYTTKFAMDMKVTEGDETVAMNMTMNDTMKKVTKKAIVLPTDVKEYDFMDLMTLTETEAIQEATTIEAETAANTVAVPTK